MPPNLFLDSEPVTDLTYSLGSTSKRWLKAWVGTLSVKTLLEAGIDDTTAGANYNYGDAANVGGASRWYNGATADTTYNYFVAIPDTSGSYIKLGTDLDDDLFKFYGVGNLGAKGSFISENAVSLIRDVDNDSLRISGGSDATFAAGGIDGAVISLFGRTSSFKPGSFIAYFMTGASYELRKTTEDGVTTLLLEVDENGKLEVLAGADFGGDLTPNNGHYMSTQTTEPTGDLTGTTLNDGAGSGAVFAVTAGSTDSAGSFTITAGNGTPGAGKAGKLVFNIAFAAAPIAIVVTAKDVDGVDKEVYITGAATTGFDVNFNQALAASEVVEFYYQVIG